VADGESKPIAEVEGNQNIAKPARKRKDIHCGACGRFICTVTFFNEFSVERDGEFLQIREMKCPKCKYKNTFTMMAKARTLEEEMRERKKCETHSCQKHFRLVKKDVVAWFCPQCETAEAKAKKESEVPAQ
jgi:hypothetical protein